MDNILNADLKNPLIGWVTLDEAAKLVGFSHPTIAYWADEGHIVAYHVGRRTRIVNLEQVKAFAAERRKSRKLMKYAGKPRR